MHFVYKIYSQDVPHCRNRRTKRLASVVNKDLTLKDKSKDCFRLGVVLIQIILVLKPKKVI